MDDNRQDKIKDVKWQNVNNKEAGIKFISKKKNATLTKLFKAIAFILVAAISGGFSGAYIVNKIYAGKAPSTINQPLVENKGENAQEKAAEIPKSVITKVSETTGPAIVGITNKPEGFLESTIGTGSGMIIDPNGYIVTNNHVVEGGSKITVKFSSGKTLDAKIIGSDPRSDLAVIKVDAQSLPIVKFGDSSKVRVGDTAVVIGNPFGDEFTGSVTSGIISALNRKVKYNETSYKVFQIDAPMNPGNSGGALCNEAGEVIGINNLQFAENLDAPGTGFSLCINEAKDIIKSLMETGKAPKPSIGIKEKTIISKKRNLSGIYVNEVMQGSSAAQAGIKPTDIILELESEKVTNFDNILDILNKHKVGDTISCKIWRDEKIIDLNIVLSELKEKK